MSGFWAQAIGAALLFGLIEGLESLSRRLLPGRRDRFHSALKVVYGLPLVLLAGAGLAAAGAPLDWRAVAAGLAIGAAVALGLFGSWRQRRVDAEHQERDARQ